MLFKSRLVPVFLFTVLAVLAGCEERIEPDPVRTTFSLVAPTNGSTVTDISEAKIKIKYSGNLKLSSSILFTLNGTDITDRFGINNITDVAVVRMTEVRNTLVQGDNELIAAQIKVDSNGVPVDANGVPLVSGDQPVILYQKVFHFYLDNTAPRITINSVQPFVANGDGSPAAGTTITVTGDMIDISNIASLSFTHAGGTQILTETTNDPVGLNQFNNTTKTYSVNLPNYPNTGIATSSPHFSYTIVDVFEHSRTEQFMASGTVIARQNALQINDPLFLNVTPLLNGMIVNAFNLLDNNSTNFFGVGSPVFDDLSDSFYSTNPRVLGVKREPQPGEPMKNPRLYSTYAPDNVTILTTGTGCVFPSPTIDNVEECRPSAYTGVHVYIYPAESAQCSGLLFNPGAGVTDCIVYIKNIDIDTPAVDIEFDEKKNNLTANLSLWFKDVDVDVEVAGVRNDGPPSFGQPDSYTYLGGLKGRVTLSKFTVETDVRFYPDNNFKIGLQRVTPFHLELTDLLKVPTVTGTCNICSQYISPFSLVILALGTDLNNNDVTDKKELVNMMGDAVENKLGPVVDNALASMLKSQTTTTDVNGKQTISSSGVIDAYAVYNNNPHFVFNGSDYVAPAFYTPEYAVVNGGLGSSFAVQGDYYKNLMPFIKGWGITLAGVKNLIDVSFAIPSNAINQWLLAQHQTGMFAENPIDLTGLDFATTDFDVDPGDLLRLTFDTHEAPSVHFTSQNTKAGQICVLGKCITKEPTPGAIKLVVNNLDIELRNQTDAVTMVDANIDMEFEVYISAPAGLPQITLKEDSVLVQVNSFTEPVDPLVTKSVLATLIGDGIESFMDSPSFQALIGPQSVPLAVSTFPGIGGSDDTSPSSPNADCDNPTSVPGTLCMNGAQIPYASVMVGQVNIIPTDIALLFRWLTVEKDGSYLSVGLDVRSKEAGLWTAGELAENYITWQLTN